MFVSPTLFHQGGIANRAGHAIACGPDITQSVHVRVAGGCANRCTEREDAMMVSGLNERVLRRQRSGVMVTADAR